MVATKVDGMHPTGMHSCLILIPVIDNVINLPKMIMGVREEERTFSHVSHRTRDVRQVDLGCAFPVALQISLEILSSNLYFI